MPPVKPTTSISHSFPWLVIGEWGSVIPEFRNEKRTATKKQRFFHTTKAQRTQRLRLQDFSL
jgi:hypothetical protein